MDTSASGEKNRTVLVPVVKPFIETELFSGPPWENVTISGPDWAVDVVLEILGVLKSEVPLP